jgi:spoIIIJ-associated protein
MHQIEIRAKSMDEARKTAAFQLGVSEEEIELEVVEEPRGVLGELGGTYRVRAFLREGAFSPREEEEPEAAPVVEAPPASAGEMDLARFSLSGDEAGEGGEVEYEFTPDAQPEPTPQYEAAMPVRPVDLNNHKPEPREEEEAEEEEEEEDTGEPKVEVAEAAKAFLEGLLPMLEIEGEAVIRHAGSQEVELELVGPDLGLLIGRYGATLDALQTVTAGAANRGMEDGARVVLDAEGYRERRLHSLESLARSTAARVKRGGREMALDNLQPHERRIIHMALRDDTDVETYSEGEGSRRRLIIAPRRGGRQ